MRILKIYEIIKGQLKKCRLISGSNTNSGYLTIPLSGHSSPESLSIYPADRINLYFHLIFKGFKCKKAKNLTEEYCSELSKKLP